MDQSEERVPGTHRSGIDGPDDGWDRADAQLVQRNLVAPHARQEGQLRQRKVDSGGKSVQLSPVLHVFPGTAGRSSDHQWWRVRCNFGGELLGLVDQ